MKLNLEIPLEFNINQSPAQAALLVYANVVGHLPEIAY